MKTSDYKDLKFASRVIRNCWKCKCALTRETATVDHLKPKSLGGKNSADNYRIACRICNEERGNASLSPQEWERVTGRGKSTKRDYSKLIAGIKAFRSRGNDCALDNSY